MTDFVISRNIVSLSNQMDIILCCDTAGELLTCCTSQGGYAFEENVRSILIEVLPSIGPSIHFLLFMLGPFAEATTHGETLMSLWTGVSRCSHTKENT